jgi:hypothetical protein
MDIFSFFKMMKSALILVAIVAVAAGANTSNCNFSADYFCVSVGQDCNVVFQNDPALTSGLNFRCQAGIKVSFFLNRSLPSIAGCLMCSDLASSE